MMPRHSGSGRPDFTPRTITSMALANSSTNLNCRRLVRRASIQRGRPRAPTNRPSSGTTIGRFGADTQMLQPDEQPAQPGWRPRTSAATCRGRRAAGAAAWYTFSRAFWRSSSSFRVSATWRRRFWTASACALTAMRLVLFSVTPWMRLSVRRSPGEVGIEQQVDDGADRHRRQQQQAGEHQVVAIHCASPIGLPRLSCTSALASACARRGVSP